MMKVLFLLGIILLVTEIYSESADAPPIAIDLYYETLCPYSIAYFTEQLYPTWLEMSEVMKVQLFPFGNAHFKANPDGGYIFICQHGLDECMGNMVHACAQKEFNDIYVEMDFVNCLLKAKYPPVAGEGCAIAVGKPWKPIELCITTALGEILLRNVGLKTEELQPPHTYVPWIVVNNNHTDDLNKACQKDQKKVVCQMYSGPTPDACAVETKILPSNYVGHSNKQEWN